MLSKAGFRNTKLRRSCGFTLLELIVAATILAVLTMMALPLARVTIQREKEKQLRHALWQMRDAIDQYKDQADRGAFQTKVDSQGYPPSYDGADGDLDFTGQFQDTTAGLYDFLAREYNPVQGRWLSPDRPGASVANTANPQTWNRYSYVSNNPLASTDPLGACDPETDASCTTQCNISSGMPCKACDPSMDGGDCGNSQLAQEAQGYFDSLLTQGKAQALAAYGSCIAFNYKCDVDGNPLPVYGSDIVITVRCGGTFATIDCAAPAQAVGGPLGVSISTSLGMQYGFGLLAQYQADPMSSSGKDTIAQLSQMSSSAEAFIIVGYGGSVISGAGGAIAADLAAGPEQSVLFGRFSPINGGFSGYLNSNSALRIGYGWNGTNNVFRVTGNLLGGAHLDWPW